MRRSVYLPDYSNPVWRKTVKKLLDKLGVTFVEESDKKKFEMESTEHVIIEYNDEDVEEILDSLDICDYVSSSRV